MNNMDCFGVYYYTLSQDYVNVKLMGIYSSRDKCLKILNENFYDYTPNVNNSVLCKNKNNVSCVLWINRYEVDKLFGDSGVTCNHPTNSIEIINLLKHH